MSGGYGFAEETAVVHDHKGGWLAIQYNHYGPRSQAISEYLSTYSLDKPNQFEFILQLNRAAHARLANKSIFTKLNIKEAPARLSKEYKKANIALVTSLESTSKIVGGDYVSVEIGLERESTTSLNLSKYIPSFLIMANEERDAVSSLTISGKEDEIHPIDPVDLIKERLEVVINNMPLDNGLRIPKEDRFNALKRAYNTWVAEGIIKE